MTQNFTFLTKTLSLHPQNDTTLHTCSELSAEGLASDGTVIPRLLATVFTTADTTWVIIVITIIERLLATVFTTADTTWVIIIVKIVIPKLLVIV